MHRWPAIAARGPGVPDQVVILVKKHARPDGVQVFTDEEGGLWTTHPDRPHQIVPLEGE